LLYSEAAEIPA
jgi:hypothetical protein